MNVMPRKRLENRFSYHPQEPGAEIRAERLFLPPEFPYFYCK